MTERATAIIGGTGLTELDGLVIHERRELDTPYGAPSAPLCLGSYHEQPVIFLARHGHGHVLPPHLINYRANLWALHALGVRHVLAVAAVGGIHPQLGPAALAVPDQLIDYTWGRAHTYSREGLVEHADFTEPYDASLRQRLLVAAQQAKIEILAGGTYGVTQGPRLETAAEVRRLQRDGCDMIGMTAMPEAALARELGIAYATLAVSVNWAAGIGSGDIHAEIAISLAQGMQRARAVIAAALTLAEVGPMSIN